MPKIINTSAEKIDDQNIALKYDHTSTVTGRVYVMPDRLTAGRSQNGVKIVIEVEDVPVAEGETRTISGRSGTYWFNVAHNGRTTIKANYAGMAPYSVTIVENKKAFGPNISLMP